jgi:hypothetical protein
MRGYVFDSGCVWWNGHIGVLDLRSGVLEVESGCLLYYAMLAYVE